MWFNTILTTLIGLYSKDGGSSALVGKFSSVVKGWNFKARLTALQSIGRWSDRATWPARALTTALRYPYLSDFIMVPLCSSAGLRASAAARRRQSLRAM